ncbi:MAG: type II secretion system F family protein [Magnetococcus sp. XQGC-1]
MPAFRYSARRQQEIVSGVVQAVDCATAASQLLAQQLEPLTIEPLQETTSWQGYRQRLLRTTTADTTELLLFSRQMFALVHAGVPLIRALQGVREHAHPSTMQEILGRVIEELQAGRDLASALANHPHLFGRLLPRLVRVGENTGRLDEAFQQMARHLEMDRERERNIRAATRYPLFVLLAAVVALFVVNYFVVPAFAGLFARFGAELPLLTRVLLTTSRWMHTYWPLLLLGLTGVVYLLFALLRTPKGRYWWDEQKLRLPLLGSIIQRALLARLMRTIAMGTRSGLTVAQTLSMVGETVDNLFMAQKLSQMYDRVERGDPVTQAAYHSGLFPPLVLQMLAVGEQTGNMGELLLEVADFYDREVAHEIQRLSAVMEPILIVIVAIFVLVLALGIFLPMWNLGSVALGRR